MGWENFCKHSKTGFKIRHTNQDLRDSGILIIMCLNISLKSGLKAMLSVATLICLHWVMAPCQCRCYVTSSLTVQNIKCFPVFSKIRHFRGPRKNFNKPGFLGGPRKQNWDILKFHSKRLLKIQHTPLLQQLFQSRKIILFYFKVTKLVHPILRDDYLLVQVYIFCAKCNFSMLIVKMQQKVMNR